MNTNYENFNLASEIKEVTKKIRSLLLVMHENDRLELFSDIMDGYCRHCGTADPKCQCWNDE